MEPLLVLLFHPKWRTGLQQQHKTKIIEFDQKLAELWVVLGPNLTLKMYLAAILDHVTLNVGQRSPIF